MSVTRILGGVLLYSFPSCPEPGNFFYRAPLSDFFWRIFHAVLVGYMPDEYLYILDRSGHRLGEFLGNARCQSDLDHNIHIPGQQRLRRNLRGDRYGIRRYGKPVRHTVDGAG
jgi:hypothetical protein